MSTVKNNYLKFGLFSNSSLNVFTNLPQIGGEIINLTYTPTTHYTIFCLLFCMSLPKPPSILYTLLCNINIIFNVMCHKYIIHNVFKYNYYLPIFRLNLNNLKHIL